MIKIQVSTEGHTHITKGTCRLFIHGSSPRREHSSYRELMTMSHIDSRGNAEFSECRRAVSMFQILKVAILYEVMERSPLESRGRFDSVNVITLGCVARAQEITRGSVLA